MGITSFLSLRERTLDPETISYVWILFAVCMDREETIYDVGKLDAQMNTTDPPKKRYARERISDGTAAPAAAIHEGRSQRLTIRALFWVFWVRQK